MNPFPVSTRRRGFAMVLAILLVVGLETTIVGSMMNMMRHQREVQRISDRMKTNMAGEAVIDRAIKLFADYVLSTDNYPTSDAIGAEVTGADVIDAGQPPVFKDYLQNWYADFAGRHSDPLSSISILAVSVALRETPNPEPRANDQWRRYEIKLSLKHNITGVNLSLTQEILVTAGKLFDFSVFYNEDLEITAGPSFMVEGPIFTNKNVYLMNGIGSTLSLKGPPHGDHPEKYVLHSAGNIYFYYKSAIAKNYLLDNPIYHASIPTLLKSDDPEIYAPGDGAEIYSSHPVITNQIIDPTQPYEHPLPPYQYFFRNNARLGSPGDNRIIVEDSEGVNQVVNTPNGWNFPFYPAVWPHDVYWTNYTSGPYHKGNLWWGTPYDGPMSVSSSFDPTNLPRLGVSWNPQAPESTNPLTSPRWTGVELNGRKVVLDSASGTVDHKTIPVGDPTLGAHVLIEPVQSSDSPEVIEKKLQSKADINLHCVNNCANYTAEGADLQDLMDLSIIKWVDFYDYRLETCDAVLEVDIGALVEYAENHGIGGDDGLVVYVETKQGPFPKNGVCSGGGTGLVKLVNGTKLPDSKGMTVVTNGRLWIQGDYNTFDYSKGTNCTIAQFQGEDGGCTVPPAAIFSDSFGVLSNGWTDSSGPVDLFASRKVEDSLTVNTAVVTGFVLSQLVRKYDCDADMMNCDIWGIPAWYDGDHRLMCPGEYEEGQAPNDANTDSGVLSSCWYYKRAGTGLYYINKNSDIYQQALARPGQELPNWDIPLAVDGIGRPAEGGAFWYPTVQPTAVGHYPGIYLEVLLPETVFGSEKWANRCPWDLVTQCRPGTGEGTGQECDPYATCPDRNGDGQPDWQWTVDESCTESCTGDCTGPKQSPTPPVCRYRPKPAYYHSRYFPLYDTKHSGGLENLINFQEDWEGINFYFSGTLTAPWTASELRVTEAGQATKPAFYGESYYRAPIRDYTYNMGLRSNPAPATPNVFSIRRKRWSEGPGG